MKEPEFPGSIGEWIKARRKRLDLTQEELARRAGCSVFALRKIKSGERRTSKQLAGLLAAALEIPGEDELTFVLAARGELSLEKLTSLVSAPFSASRPNPRPASHHLPLPTTPLLGRETELDALERIFNDPQCRLLTLTGMGGMGKTRLAIEFAASRRGMFPGGVIFTPLASINSAELIGPAIAEALGFSFSGPIDPKEQLLAFMAGNLKRNTLLVLDNLEHLMAASSEATGVVSEILQRVPHLKILTTSRERLNLHGEWLYELHGLPVPPSEYAGNFEVYSAVALFVQCARRINPDFESTEDKKTGLSRICHLLEGIPLAIELAAAWAGMLSCDEIAREIESNIDFLETSMRDIPERHRSLRASFNHSWKFLSETERTALCRLAVFHGGFDRVAAQKIAGARLPLLASLASKSLVRRGENGRYDLHEVIRQFALSQQDENSAQHFKACEEHSAYYLAFAALQEKALRSAPQQQAARELIDEMDNIRAAWIWAIRGEKFSLLGSSVRSLGWFFEVSGLIREGIEQFEPLVRVLRSKSPDHEWQWVLGQGTGLDGRKPVRPSSAG